MKWQNWAPVAAVVVAIVAFVLWSNQNSDGEANTAGTVPMAWQVPDRTNPCMGIIGDAPLDRTNTCLSKLGRTKLSSSAQGVVDELAKKGKTFVAARVAVAGEILKAEEQPELLALLHGVDERAAARALSDAGVLGVVISRDLTGALDRDAVVLSRLARHDHLEWFELRFVTAEALVYEVRASSARLPLSVGAQLLTGLRTRLEGGKPVPQTWRQPGVRLLGTVRLQGEALAIRHSVKGLKDGVPEDRVLDAALDDLADSLKREWERKIQVKGLGSLPERLGDLRLEVHVVVERAPVEPRSRYQIFDLWEIGVDGMFFKAPPGSSDEKFTYFPGSEAITRAIHTADDFLSAGVEPMWRDRRPWEDESTQLDIVRTQHFMDRDRGGGTGAVALFRGAPEVPLEHVTDRNVQSMLVAGGEWWLTNQYPDGSYEYKYWPEQNRRSLEYNEVRHELGIRDLADTFRYRRDPRYLEGSFKGLDWLNQYLVADTDPVAGPFKISGRDVLLPHPPPGSSLYRYPKVGQGNANQKLGTVAVGILAVVALAEATESHHYDELLRRLGKFTLAMLDEDGKFTAYYVPKEHPYASQVNDIVPGEAALALGKLANYFGEKEWITPYTKFVDYYQPWFRERAGRKVSGGRWPADTYTNADRLELVQFGPWSVMAAAQAHAVTGEARAVEFGLEVADWMIDNYQWSAERAPFPDYVGGYYKMPEELPAMQTFCYSEGTAAAWGLAARAAPERRQKYETSTREAIRFLEVMQFDAVDSYFTSAPGKVNGGIKYEMAQNKIRIDYVGHGLSTLSQYLDVRAADTARPLEIADPADLAAVSPIHPGTPEELAFALHGTPLPVPPKTDFTLQDAVELVKEGMEPPRGAMPPRGATEGERDVEAGD